MANIARKYRCSNPRIWNRSFHQPSAGVHNSFGIHFDRGTSAETFALKTKLHRHSEWREKGGREGGSGNPVLQGTSLGKKRFKWHVSVINHSTRGVNTRSCPSSSRISPDLEKRREKKIFRSRQIDILRYIHLYTSCNIIISIVWKGNWFFLEKFSV